jgi:DNA-binding HxlR family transcriptional regulator
VRGRRCGNLLGRLPWPARPGRNGPAVSGRGGRRARDRALDWRAALVRLAPVQRRWDLAILCNLDEDTGRRPSDLVEAINKQAEAGRQLSPQVLSGRLRTLEQDGYISHLDVSVIPLVRLYYLQPPGLELVTDLARIIPPQHPEPGTARAPRQPSEAAR